MTVERTQDPTNPTAATNKLSIDEQVRHTAAEYGHDFNPRNLALVLSLYRTLAALDRDQSDEFTRVRLTVSQFNVLTVLHRAGEPLTMKELAHAVAVRPTNLTNVVDALCKKSLTTRTLNPNDRRSLHVDITEDGERFLQDFLPGHWRRLDDVLSGLSDVERESLIGLLAKLEDSIHKASSAQYAPSQRGTRHLGK